MAYFIRDVPLIPQTLDNACWYASARMLIEWRRARVRACEGAHPTPVSQPQVAATHLANNGLQPEQFTPLAKALGLREVPPSSPTTGAMEDWLRRFGPLWFAGYFPSAHVVVITGVGADGLAVHDPWPVGLGKRDRLAWDRFVEILLPIEHVGTPSTLASNLMHLPA